MAAVACCFLSPHPLARRRAREAAWNTLFLSASVDGVVKLYAPVQLDARISDRRKV